MSRKTSRSQTGNSEGVHIRNWRSRRPGVKGRTTKSRVEPRHCSSLLCYLRQYFSPLPNRYNNRDNHSRNTIWSPRQRAGIDRGLQSRKKDKEEPLVCNEQDEYRHISCPMNSSTKFYLFLRLDLINVVPSVSLSRSLHSLTFSHSATGYGRYIAWCISHI